MEEDKDIQVPDFVIELLQGEILIYNEAQNRWNRKVHAAALAAGVPKDVSYTLQQNQDGTFYFKVQ